MGLGGGLRRGRCRWWLARSRRGRRWGPRRRGWRRWRRPGGAREGGLAEEGWGEEWRGRGGGATGLQGVRWRCGGAKAEPVQVRRGAGGEGSFGVGDELLELGRGGETATQPCDGCAEGVGGGDVLEVLVGLYGEGGGAGDGEGRRQPGSVGMGLSGCDEGLDGLEGRQGGRGGGGGSVPSGDQGEELVEVEAEGGLVEVGAGVPGTFGGGHQAGGGRGDREVLHGPGGHVAVLAHNHNAHGRVVGVGLGDGGEAVE